MFRACTVGLIALVTACGDDAASPGAIDAGPDAGASPADAGIDRLSPGDGDAAADAPGDRGPTDAADGAPARDAAQACCTRDSPYDAECASRSEPPDAYRCFCPGGSVNPACAVNPGALIVCCPSGVAP